MEITAGENYKKGLWVFLGFFIIFLIINILVGEYFYEFALYHEILDILIPCLIYLKITKQPILSTLKLDKKISRKSILIVFQLFLISFLLKIGINYLVLLTGQIDPSEVTTRVVEMVPNLFVFFITVSIIPVFLEEVIIRGVVLGNFKGTSLWQSSVMTGLLFGFMHVDLGQFGYTTALGIIMAAIVLSTGSLWGSILFHFMNNFLTFAIIAIYQTVEKYIPNEYRDILSQTDTSQEVIQNNLLNNIYGATFGVVCLGLGIFLTLHYIKRLQRVNQEERLNEIVEIEEVTEGKVYQEELESKVPWKNLFLNVPFFIIIMIYVGINSFIIG